MRKLGLALLAATALAGCDGPTAHAPAAKAAPAPSAAPAEAKAFLESLYAHYASSSSSGTTWAPMDADVNEVFDPDTAALIDADAKALDGELGDIDGDWLCDCQDWGAIAAAVAVDTSTPTTARAHAVFHDTEVKDAPPRRDTFDLVKTAAGWRIHDMGTPEDPSLRAVLQREIARLKRGKTEGVSGR